MALIGKEALTVWIDEWAKIDEGVIYRSAGRGGLTGWLDDWKNIEAFKIDRALEIFEDERVPDVTVKIYEHGFDKHDPRHPNPAAGHRSTKSYVVKCGDKQIGLPFGNLQAAKMKARTVHERMVEAVLALRREQELEKLATTVGNPKYGMF